MPKPILLPTSLVGSYPQPDWLIDRDELVKSVVRLRAEHLWLIDKEHREAAQDDATILAVRDQERAGLDIISDGEQARESYSNHFATALEGVDLDKPGQTPNRFGKMIPVPRIAGKIRRKHPVEVHAVKLVRANTDRMVKATVPGAFTMSVQAQDDFYKDPEALANDYATAVNAEIKDLFAAGADIVQLDEPWMVSFADRARKYGIGILDRAIAGATGTTAVHLCLGYAHVVKSKPSTYAFLAELEGSKIDQVSVEAAEPKLDLAVLKDLPIEDHHSGGPQSRRHDDRDAGGGRRPHPQRTKIRPGRTARHRTRLRHEIHAARGRVWKDAGDGRRRKHRAQGIELGCASVICTCGTHGHWT